RALGTAGALWAEKVANQLERQSETPGHPRRFAGLVAHQFRTPLAVIDSAMHRLTRRSGGPVPPELVSEKAAVSREAVARLVKLTDTALMMSRLEANAVPPCLRPPALSDLVSLVIDDLMRQVWDRDPARIQESG